MIDDIFVSEAMRWLTMIDVKLQEIPIELEKIGDVRLEKIDVELSEIDIELSLNI